MIVVPENYLPYLEAAEKKTADEAALRKELENGFVYNKRKDFDVVKFFESNVPAEISKIKKNYCQY